MKIKFTLLTLLVFFICTAIAQTNIKAYIPQNTYEILTDNADTLYDADLEKFGEAIGDKRIVMLGEQEHGDAATFLLKCRLIKYLHEKKGFNVLAFESDFFSLTLGWDKMSNRKADADSFAKQNIFPIWTFCHTCQNLFTQYIPQTQNTASPLQLAGFDCQFHGVYAGKNGKLFIQNLFNRLSYANRLKAEIETALPYCDSLFSFKILTNRSDYEKAAKALEEIIEADKKTNELTALEQLIIQNLISESYSLSNVKFYNKGGHYYRDRQMAANLTWLANEKFKNEKIIVWAHNAHIGKNRIEAAEDKDNQLFMMGDFLFSDPLMAKQMYIAGFTSFSGRVNWTTTNRFDRKLQKPRKNSFERWIDDQYKICFYRFYRLQQAKPG